MYIIIIIILMDGGWLRELGENVSLTDMASIEVDDEHTA